MAKVYGDLGLAKIDDEFSIVAFQKIWKQLIAHLDPKDHRLICITICYRNKNYAMYFKAQNLYLTDVKILKVDSQETIDSNIQTIDIRYNAKCNIPVCYEQFLKSLENTKIYEDLKKILNYLHFIFLKQLDLNLCKNL